MAWDSVAKVHAMDHSLDVVHHGADDTECHFEWVAPSGIRRAIEQPAGMRAVVKQGCHDGVSVVYRGL